MSTCLKSWNSLFFKSFIGKVVRVERFNDRVMKVNNVTGDVVWEVVS